MLSIRVALILVIRVGLVIAGNSPALYIILTNCSVIVQFSLSLTSIDEPSFPKAL